MIFKIQMDLKILLILFVLFVFNRLLPKIVSVENVNFGFHSQSLELLLTLLYSSKIDHINPLTGIHIHISGIMFSPVLMICYLSKLFELFFFWFGNFIESDSQGSR